jgi:hypothetical protein
MIMPHPEITSDFEIEITSDFEIERDERLDS